MSTPGNNDTLDPDAMTGDEMAAAPAGRYGPGDEELGRGGLGRVLRVHDRHLDRTVARKELLVPGVLLGSRPRARFEREARITARLEHPNILPVYEFGEHEDGTPWYTTRVIRGPTLERALEAAGSLAERLRLLPSVVAAGQALAYAHAERVVHRDVTPRNIMVGPFGETVLIDWGLAKRLDAPEDEPDPGPVAERGDLTVAGTPHGTIAYASPEQLAGDLARIDTRTDVFGLGATLFHVVAGRPPRVRAGTDLTIPPVRRVAPAAPVELASIVDRALQPNPDRRYPTVAAMVDDLVAWQVGRPVTAHPYGPVEHLQRVVRARPREALIAGVAAVALTVGTIGALGVWFAKDAREQEARAGKATAGALLAAGEGRHALTLAHAVEALQVYEEPDVRGTVIAAGRRWLPRPLARWTLPSCDRGSAGPDGESVACLAGPTVRLHTGGAVTEWTLPDEVVASAWSPDGSRLAVALHDGQVTHLLPGDPAPRPFGALTTGSPYSLVWIDADRLAAGTVSGSVEVLAGGVATVLVPPRPDTLILSLDSTGDALLVGSTRGAQAWRISTGERLWGQERGGLGYVTAVPGRPFVVATAPAADGDPFVHALSLDTGEVLATAELPFGGQGRPVTTPDGLTVLVPSADGRVAALAVPSLDVRAMVDLDEAVRPRLAVTERGLVLTRTDGVIERWALPERWPARAVEVAPGLVYTAAVSPSGTRIATPSTSGLVKAWSWPTLTLDRTWTVPDPGLEATVWLDDARVLTTGSEGRVFVLGEDGVVAAPPIFAGNAYGLALLGAEGIVAGGKEGRLGRWSRSTGVAAWERFVEGVVVGLVVVDGGRSAVVPSLAGVYRVSLADGHEEERLSEEGLGFCAQPAASPDGTSVVLGTSRTVGGSIQRRATAHLTERAWDTVTEARPAALAWSPDGAWISAGLLDGHVLVLDAAEGSVRARLRAHPGQVWGVSYLDDGRALATTGSDGTLRVWDLSDLLTPVDVLAAALEPPPG